MVHVPILQLEENILKRKSNFILVYKPFSWMGNWFVYASWKRWINSVSENIGLTDTKRGFFSVDDIFRKTNGFLEKLRYRIQRCDESRKSIKAVRVVIQFIITERRLFLSLPSYFYYYCVSYLFWLDCFLSCL